MTIPAKKIVQSLVLIAVFFSIGAVANPELPRTAHIWVLALVSILGSIFQPNYSPFQGAPSAEDRGTALQIVWSIYIPQLAAVLEAGLLRYPESLRWDWISTVATVIMFIGVFVRSWGFITLGRQFSWHIDRRVNQSLVTSGPYRYVRHPGYVGAFLTYVFGPALFHAWYACLLSVVLIVFAYYRRIRIEERVLQEAFGSEYRDYCARVKRFIPGIW